MNFSVKTKTFDGPLDLLLHLVKKKKLDITIVSIANIVDDFILYMQNIKDLEIEQTTAFLEVATILIRIKVRAIFPRETENELEDESTDLLLKLMNKKYYSVLADMMTQWEDDDRCYFKRGEHDYTYIEDVDPSEYLDDVTLLNLAIIFDNILNNLERESETINLKSYDLTISGQKNWIASLCKKKSWRLNDIFRQLPDRFSVVVSFLALLECMKDGLVIVAFDEDQTCIVMSAKKECESNDK